MKWGVTVVVASVGVVVMLHLLVIIVFVFVVQDQSKIRPVVGKLLLHTTMEDPVTTKLLTLLNVSAVKSVKKRRVYDELVAAESTKLNKRKSTKFEQQEQSGQEDAHVNGPSQPAKKEAEPMDVDEKDEDCGLYVVRFKPKLMRYFFQQ